MQLSSRCGLRLYGRLVGLTGVIYAAIVVAWAAYLVPLALRRHDEAARSRSIDRFSGAMRVLSRREPSTAGRLVVTPPRAVDRLVNPGLTRRDAAAPVSAVARPSRRSLRVAAARRRRVVILLLCLTIGVAAAAGFRVLPVWSPAVPFALVVVFLALVRRQVRKASDAYWVQVASASLAPSNVVRRTPTRVDASHGAAKGPDEEPTVPIDTEAVKEAVTVAAIEPERSVAVALSTADGASLWDPLPITLPTYVDKPVAARTSRRIELGEPGTWSSGHSAELSKGEASTAELSTAVEAAKTAATSGGGPGGEDAAADEEPPRAVNG